MIVVMLVTVLVRMLMDLMLIKMVTLTLNIDDQIDKKKHRVGECSTIEWWLSMERKRQKM